MHTIFTKAQRAANNHSNDDKINYKKVDLSIFVTFISYFIRWLCDGMLPFPFYVWWLACLPASLPILLLLLLLLFAFDNGRNANAPSDLIMNEATSYFVIERANELLFKRARAAKKKRFCTTTYMEGRQAMEE